MKRIRLFLVVVITLSLVAGYIRPVDGGNGQIKNTAYAAAKKTITVKAASDFTLKLPSGWKNNYVRTGSKKRTTSSYVTFYSKKCYQETREGWLFSIGRYKDDSYTDLPCYELVGKWNGLNYVAVFPSDIQTMGATKAAKKQYRKMNSYSLSAVSSIQPVKTTRKGKDVYRISAFSLKLPSDWRKNYIVKKTGKNGKDVCVTFYAKKCHEQTNEGWLFSIQAFQDDSYRELPAYELAGKWNGISYVAVFPTDVQFTGASKKAVKQYQKLNKSVEKVVGTIRR